MSANPGEVTQLTNEPIEIPNMNAWRWRAQKAIRLAGMDKEPRKGYGQAITYFFDSLRRWDKNKIIHVIKVDESTFAQTDRDNEAKEQYINRFAKIQRQTITEYLGDEFPKFVTDDPYVPISGTCIERPLDFVNRLAEIREIVATPGKAPRVIAPIAESWAPNIRPPILPGLLYVLQLTQSRILNTAIGHGYYLSDIPSEHLHSFSFNTLIAEASQAEDEGRQTAVSRYVLGLQQLPTPEFKTRVGLHQQLAHVAAEL